MLINPKIVEIFKKTKNIQRTALEAGVSVVTVRRTLLTVGEWSSPKSREIAVLLEEGLSYREIADRLCTTVGAVEAYSPYRVGNYHNNTPSNEALRCDLYRKRKMTARGRSKGVKDSEMEWRIWTLDQPRNTHGYHLRLELDCSELDDKQMGILKQYGDVKEAFSRDILVPGSMTLHALHYAIQRAFGFTNSHDRRFVFPESVFQSLTDNELKKFYSLAGVYFQPSLNELNELYWDDHYDGRISFNSWLKEKYQGPYRYAAECSHPEVCKARATELLGYYEEMGQVDSAHRMMGDLLESLRLEDIFLFSGEATKQVTSKAEPLTTELHYYYHSDQWHVIVRVVNDSTELSAHPEVISDEKPLCIAADGHALFDLSFLSDYCSFLNTINNGSIAQRDIEIEKAIQSGWSPRRTSPRLIL